MISERFFGETHDNPLPPKKNIKRPPFFQKQGAWPVAWLRYAEGRSSRTRSTYAAHSSRSALRILSKLIVSQSPSPSAVTPHTPVQGMMLVMRMAVLLVMFHQIWPALMFSVPFVFFMFIRFKRILWFESMFVLAVVDHLSVIDKAIPEAVGFDYVPLAIV